MDPEKTKPKLPSSSKYNYEALQAYNFDKIDFDFDFGEIDEKKHKDMLK